MINTLYWRIKEAFAVLIGSKKTVVIKNKSYSPQEFENMTPYTFINKDLEKYISSLNIEFIFSEFGEERVNCGGTDLGNISRLQPSFSTLKKYFPNAKYTVYSDFDLNIDGVQLIKVKSPIKNKQHPRHLYHTANYYKFYGLANSSADFKCAIDSDMFVVSEDIYSLIYLTELFGFCAAYNSRNLLKKDMKISKDTGIISDLSNANGHSYNQSPMTLWKNNEIGKLFFEKCCEIMIKEPSRASLVMWKAARESKSSPYLLPTEFCVCAENVGIGDEIILHIGHPSVAKYYNVKL